MISFQDVLSEVRRVLQELQPDLLPLLLTQLFEARIFSEQYLQSLFESAEGAPGDLDDLARRLALPVWQNWDASKGIIVSVEKQPEIHEAEDICPDVDLWIPDCITELLDLDVNSPAFEEFLNSDFNDDVFNLTDGAEEKSILACDKDPVLHSRPSRKRRAGQKASEKPPRPKRSKPASLSSENPPVITASGLEGDFRIVSPANVPALVHVPLTFTTTSLVPTGVPAMPFIQTINPYSAPVIKSFISTGSTYVLVSPPAVTLPPQITPSSPADGAVAPVELSMCTHPISSFSESASRGQSPSPLTPHPPVSPSKDQTPPKEFRLPASQTTKTPTMPKSVEGYIESCKSHLDQVCCRMEGGLQMASHYINTQLVKRKLVIRTGKNANKCLDKELVVLSESERCKAAVQRNYIFQNLGTNQKHLITVLGKAGMGKSTLIQRLALDWSAGELQQFQFVFLLNCKFLNLTQPIFSLQRLLLEASVCPPCEDSESVFKQVLASPKKVLVIFDSFDDMKDLEGLLQCPATSVTERSYTVRQIFSGLFQKKLLSGCTLVIASRPRDVLNQLLRKVDCILEVSCFSPKDIEEYASKYFGDPMQRESALKKMKSQKYIFSLCSNPLLCRYTCFFLEHHDGTLPSTLTDLCLRLLGQELEVKLDGSKPDLLQQLCNVAWEGLKTQNSLLDPTQNKDLVDYGLSCGLLRTHSGTARQEPPPPHFGNLYVQNFLGALLMVHSSEMNDKTLIGRTTLHQRKRKAPGEWQDILQCFIMGFLFQKTPHPCCRFLQNTTDLQAKRKAVEVHLENLKPAELIPSRLLELFHCVYEAKSLKLSKLLVKNLPDGLSFCGAQLSPADAYVVWHLLQHTKGLKRTFSLDLRDTCVPLTGLKELVALDCLKSFRAPTMDTILLWEDLHRSTDAPALRRAIQKFTIDPLKVSQVCHVENLQVLVRIHREKRLPSCEADTLEDGVPAVRQLHKLEYELRQQNGPKIFLTFTELLPDLQALQFLDLENNKIGDAGAAELAEAFQAFSSLQTLNLSQNCIGDVGVEKLAKALASASSLQSLSLYGNLIADCGAESLASVLPLMKMLLDLDVKYNKFTDVGAKKLGAALKSSSCIKSLQMWNECIPYGVFEHLQLQDSRIKAL